MRNGTSNKGHTPKTAFKTFLIDRSNWIERPVGIFVVNWKLRFTSNGIYVPGWVRTTPNQLPDTKRMQFKTTKLSFCIPLISVIQKYHIPFFFFFFFFFFSNGIRKIAIIILKFWQMEFYPSGEMCPKDAGSMANSVCGKFGSLG